MYSSDRKYAAVVVGAGAGGIGVVGNLLDLEQKPVLWVDEAFQGGRLNQSYREVPSSVSSLVFYQHHKQGTGTDSSSQKYQGQVLHQIC